MFEKDISQLAKPEIKGRGFLGSGKEIIETQTYYTQPENDWEFDDQLRITYNNPVYIEQCKRRGIKVDDSGFVKQVRLDELEEKKDEDIEDEDIEDDDINDDDDWDDDDEDESPKGIKPKYASNPNKDSVPPPMIMSSQSPDKSKSDDKDMESVLELFKEDNSKEEDTKKISGSDLASALNAFNKEVTPPKSLVEDKSSETTEEKVEIPAIPIIDRKESIYEKLNDGAVEAGVSAPIKITFDKTAGDVNQVGSTEKKKIKIQFNS